MTAVPAALKVMPVSTRCCRQPMPMPLDLLRMQPGSRRISVQGYAAIQNDLQDSIAHVHCFADCAVGERDRGVATGLPNVDQQIEVACDVIGCPGVQYPVTVPVDG